MSILIKNGNIILSDEIFNGDIFIENKKISEIEKDIDKKADLYIDAKGKYVMAGGIDPHTHMSLDLGNYIAIDDFYTGTVAASHGGTTTIIDHIAFGAKDSKVSDMIEKYHEMADGNAVIDYSFHSAMQSSKEDILEEMDYLYNEGIVSTKIYTTYGGKLDDDEMLKVLKKAKNNGMIVCVHCENDGMIKELRSEAMKNHTTDPIYQAITRPAEAEAEAINRLTYLSELAGFPKLYIVHISSALGIREIENARNRGVKNLYAETCTQYLTYTEDKYIEGGNSEGVKYICAPPLRKKEDIEALWTAISENVIDVIATDHCPFFYKRDKLPHKDDFLQAPGGIPGVEERIEVVLTEGRKRGISLIKLVKLLTENPAKIFGLGDKKGKIEKGFDADITIFNKDSYIISKSNRHSACDYTTYEGFKTSFKIDTVISKGVIILDKGGYYGQKGMGEFLKREFK